MKGDLRKPLGRCRTQIRLYAYCHGGRKDEGAPRTGGFEVVIVAALRLRLVDQQFATILPESRHAGRIASGHGPREMGCRGCQLGWQPDVVLIAKRDVVETGNPCISQEAEEILPRPAGLALRHSDGPISRPAIQNCERAVRGAVVVDENLHLDPFLREQAVQLLVEPARAVIGRQQHGNLWNGAGRHSWWIVCDMIR